MAKVELASFPFRILIFKICSVFFSVLKDHALYLPYKHHVNEVPEIGPIVVKACITDQWALFKKKNTCDLDVYLVEWLSSFEIVRKSSRKVSQHRQIIHYSTCLLN